MAKAVATSTMIRLPATASIIYVPEIQDQSGDYFPETKTTSTMADVVEDIATAQLERVRRVIAINIAEGECWDASAAIAAAVLVRVLDRHNEVPAWCDAFLETHLGIHNVREAAYEHRQAA